MNEHQDSGPEEAIDKVAEQAPSGGIKRFIPLGIIILGLILFFALGLDRYISLSALRENREAITDFVAANALWAPLGFIVLYAVLVAVVPPTGTVLTLTGGFLFGWLLGGFIVVFAATLGATALFLAARTAFGDLLREKAGSAVQKMREGFQRDAFSYLLFLRLVPVFPFFVVNLVPAFLNVKTRTYVITTFIGIIPGTFVYASLGASLGALIEEEDIDLGLIFEPQYLLPLLGLAVLSLIPVILKRVRRAKG
ncbi:MAG: TVP38/TMEM64 family protein [Alphaproteobacteria bacterium]|nr:TVP38/TMEM64 family protein [Alphaproteobacteria bacterium]